MQPRWLLFSSVLNVVLAEEEPWLSAVNAILIGTSQNNFALNTSDLQMYPSPSVTAYHAAFHHHYAASTQPPSGQSCMMPVQIGTGPYRIPRWFYNPARGRCELFYWSGCCGNGNNFQTYQSCQSLCEEAPNPCAVTVAVPLSQCTPGVRTCGAGNFCHVGASPQTTVCCPKPAPIDRCQQPLNVGIGSASLQRWYFNPLTQQCQPCTYLGLQGNENNFLTKQECESTCLLNACKIGTPYRTQGLIVHCSAANPSVCPAGHYCHVGAGPPTSVCCQALGSDPCSQPMDVGIGSAQLQRWYWNVQSQMCLPFSYCGLKGTQNNFLSKQDCERTCYVLDNPCALGLPQMTLENRPLMCSVGQNTCSDGYWCHYGANQKTTVCCPGRVEGLAICQQSLALGNGEATLARWYYDAASMRCVQFYYRGHYGNQNNFLSLEECERTCPVFVNPCNQPIPLPPRTCSAVGPDTCGPSSWCHIGVTPETTLCCPSEGDPCTLPLNRGSGNQYTDRWYFNKQTGVCQPFLYAGLHGNQNNFLTREACEERCGPNPCFEGRPFVGVDGRPQTCADLSTTVCCPGASTNICNLPMSTGEGNYNLERYYFDQASKTCRPFIYNGLKGNQNNFMTLRACQLACQPLDNPCIGQPATTAAGQVLFCSPTNKDACPVNFWCHIGATPETTVCCPGATNPCSVPLAPGTGNAGLSRWYYNPDDRQCLPFQYNGKRGNQNNFETQAECERTCPEQLCLLSIDRGACGGRQTRYAFNRQTSQCIPFDYTGCGGNLNNFVSMMDCMATCGNVGFRR
ncbi:hypothetical protein KIN20_006025 [Parelaphostrongylus tenuis]|uniref:BPTI/Kunitz inhibitor domain-containing protein n=2 Tax=Strongyloidea TaxID=27829 RepID=A0AAD5MJK2_PARTN|nr:hypothetical protein KIN20_006025 [Parelaphostrongylus tenuis]